MRGRHLGSLLGLFPVFTDVGGIQQSGRMAWEGIVRHCGGHTRLSLILYGRGPLSQNVNFDHHNVEVFRCPSRIQAAVTALKHRWDAQTVLIGHINFLKFVPLLRLWKSRWVTFLYGIESWRPHSKWMRSLLKRVDLFLTISDYTWQRFLDYHPELSDRPHRTVHLGWGEPVTGAIPPPVDPPVAIMISRLERQEDYKGHREVIAAWPRVSQYIPNARLWIVGSGSLLPDLQRQVRTLGLENSIQFWGTVPEAQKERLLMQARCLLMPSRGEGFGLVYLEAMRLGRPCLVSTLDAGREVVNPPEAGLAVDPGDTEALAEAIYRLLTPGPEWDRWSVQARRRYESRFTARHFQERLVSALSLEAP